MITVREMHDKPLRLSDTSFREAYGSVEIWFYYRTVDKILDPVKGVLRDQLHDLVSNQLDEEGL